MTSNATQYLRSMKNKTDRKPLSGAFRKVNGRKVYTTETPKAVK